MLTIDPIEDFRPPGELGPCEHSGCGADDLPSAPGANGCGRGYDRCCGNDEC